MKKYFSIFLSLICILGCLSVSAGAEEVLNYTFENTDGLIAVTNTLKDGGVAVVENGTLKLESNYGLDLGKVDNTFSVVAMVNVTTTGDFETVFFKNMGDATNQKWTGFKFEKGVPTVWTQGDGKEWFKAVVAKKAYTNQWVHVAYIEDNGIGRLYIEGTLVGEGEVVKGEGNLYLGSTFWAGDAIGGSVDNLVLFDTALNDEEVQKEHEKNISYYIHVPEIAINDIELTKAVGTAEIVWISSDESVVKSDGTIVRADEDKNVTLTATVDGKVIEVFEVRVLKKTTDVNNSVILSYDFKENDNGVIRDKSGNGNDAIAHNSLQIGEDGAFFDGNDDYVELQNGLLYGNEEITIVTTFKPEVAQQHVSLYCFGNSLDAGYMFLNPSRPTTNLIRFAATKTNGEKEIEIASLPGVRANAWATVVTVIKGSDASMYVDGELVMDGNLGMSVNDLGETTKNYIAKSLYTADPYFKGIISEFTIYNYAMTDEKIAELYKKDAQYETNAPTSIGNEFHVENGKLICNENYSGGILTVSGYDAEGRLVKVYCKAIDLKKGDIVKIDDSFMSGTFTVTYWG